MRQGQQNRRGRGRNNNNNQSHGHNNGARKGQNPLARSFESSGPDVKLRGTPAHIAEKYMALARDAQSSGDPVLAENYLQHAEHYNRIILAYREQQIAQGGGDPGTGAVPRPRSPFGEPGDVDSGDDEGEDQGQGFQGGSMAQPPVGLGEQPPIPMQPRFEGRPPQQQREHRGEHQPRGEHPRFQHRDRHPGEQRGGFQDRGDRPVRSDRPERLDRPDRAERPDRPERPERPERVERHDRPERIEPAERPERADRPVAAEGNPADAPPRRRERFQPSSIQHDQPEFLRRPVRRPRREEGPEAAPQPAPAAVVDDQE